MEAHFVEFFSPGTFVAETSTKPIDSWDIETAKTMARSVKERQNACPYGFQFITRKREDNELDSKEIKRSPMYYLGGKVETLEEVKARGRDSDRILIHNMESNDWKRVITTTEGWRWTQALKDTDIVLEFERTTLCPPKVKPDAAKRIAEKVLNELCADDNVIVELMPKEFFALQVISAKLYRPICRTRALRALAEFALKGEGKK